MRDAVLNLFLVGGSLPSSDTLEGRAHAAYSAFLGTRTLAASPSHDQPPPPDSAHDPVGGLPGDATSPGAATTPGTTHNPGHRGRVFAPPPSPGEPLDPTACEEAGRFVGEMKLYQSSLSHEDATTCRSAWQRHTQIALNGFPSRNRWYFPTVVPKPGSEPDDEEALNQVWPVAATA